MKTVVFWAIALMMGAASISETSANFCQTTRRDNPESSRLHTRRRENLKCNNCGNIIPTRPTTSHVFNPMPRASLAKFLSSFNAMQAHSQRETHLFTRSTKAAALIGRYNSRPHFSRNLNAPWHVSPLHVSPLPCVLRVPDTSRYVQICVPFAVD
jgi:hypothetical protein